MIEGVIIEKLNPHIDHRGYFIELLRSKSQIANEGIGQISHSLVYGGIIKAWHAHKYQTQWNYVVNGLIYVALYDNRKDSKTYAKTLTFLVGDNQNNIMYKFPPGVLHGYKCINGPMNIIYITSGEYDTDDEVRIKHNDQNIGFDWVNTFEIK